MKIVSYEEKMGPYHLPEGFGECLQGLSIEAQMDRYRTTQCSQYSKTHWSERTVEGRYRRLEETSVVKALIVKDGILIGVMMLDDDGREQPCFAEGRVCTYYACDNNGAGYDTRIDYTHLLCVPGNSDQG